MADGVLRQPAAPAHHPAADDDRQRPDRLGEQRRIEQQRVEPGEAAQAQRVVVMHQGKIAADGAPKAVFSQVDLLHQIGLAAPDSVELCWKLNQEGFDLPLDKLNPEECAQALYERIKA